MRLRGGVSAVQYARFVAEHAGRREGAVTGVVYGSPGDALLGHTRGGGSLLLGRVHHATIIQPCKNQTSSVDMQGWGRVGPVCRRKNELADRVSVQGSERPCGRYEGRLGTTTTPSASGHGVTWLLGDGWKPSREPTDSNRFGTASTLRKTEKPTSSTEFGLSHGSSRIAGFLDGGIGHKHCKMALRHAVVLTNPGRLRWMDGARRLLRVAREDRFGLACCRLYVDRAPDLLQKRHRPRSTASKRPAKIS